MRLTAFTDYALRALMRMASASERWFTAEEMAGTLVISRNHLTKIVARLAAEGFIETRRGAQGGMRLSRAGRSVTLGRIVRALEARHALVECFVDGGGACVLTPACRLKARLTAAREAFFRELDKTTLSACAVRDGDMAA